MQFLRHSGLLNTYGMIIHVCKREKALLLLKERSETENHKQDESIAKTKTFRCKFHANRTIKKKVIDN